MKSNVGENYLAPPLDRELDLITHPLCPLDRYVDAVEPLNLATDLQHHADGIHMLSGQMLHGMKPVGMMKLGGAPNSGIILEVIQSPSPNVNFLTSSSGWHREAHY